MNGTCVADVEKSHQNHTKYGNLYLKWYKYTVHKWKINVLKRSLVQSQQALNQNYTAR